MIDQGSWRRLVSGYFASQPRSVRAAIHSHTINSATKAHKEACEESEGPRLHRSQFPLAAVNHTGQQTRVFPALVAVEGAETSWIIGNY